MKLDYLAHCIELARFCYRNGLPITADTHMRYALGEANRLGRRDLQRSIFCIRNRLRPYVIRATAPRATILN